MNDCKILSCNKCDISLRRNSIVNGVGNLKGRVMIIGEAPGYYEDKHGVPFVGNSGQFLTYLLDLIGLKRSDVYLTNVIKCRPDGNRNPTAKEISNCLPNLINEIKVIQPKIIVLLGGVALNTYYQKSSLTVNSLKGYILPASNNSYVMVMYHPSYVLRNIKNEGLVRSYVNNFYTLGKLYRALINPLVTFKV